MTRVIPGLISQADQAFHAFTAYLDSLPVPTEESSGDFYNIITALGRVGMKNYAALRHAFDDDNQELLAWSCRNLLELDIITLYVLQSKAHADEFAAHRLIDGLDIAQRLKKLEFALNPGLTASSLDRTIAEMNAKMTAEGIARGPYLSAYMWAQAVNKADEYVAINKVCTKLVHPTAWSILTADLGSQKFPEARDLFYASGAGYFAEIFNSIKGHIEKHGLQHNPTPPPAAPGVPSADNLTK